MTTKYALLVGINYIGTSSELYGCINDIKNTEEILISKYGYKKENIVILSDEDKDVKDILPTGENIVKHLTNLISRTNTEKVSQIWFSYSGHGSHSKDILGDELDGNDEALVPLDYETNDMIYDDQIYGIIKNINSNTSMISIIDSCHSGTMFDLNYRYISGIKNVKENNNRKILSNIIMVSGCMDSQTSADAVIDNKNAGALTASILKVLYENNYTISCYKFLKFVRELMIKGNFEQIPQITSSKLINNNTMFLCNEENKIIYDYLQF